MQLLFVKLANFQNRFLLLNRFYKIIINELRKNNYR